MVQEADPAALYLEVLGRVCKLVAADFGHTATDEEDSAFAASIADWPLFLDTIDALGYLKQHGLLMVLSNVDRVSFAHNARRLGNPFHAVVTAEAVWSYKPAPAQFERATALLTDEGIEPGEVLHVAGTDNADIDTIAERNSSHVRWDRELKNNLRRLKEVRFSVDNIWRTQYRPFVKQHCYVDYTLVNNKYQKDRIFPSEDSENRAIYLPGVSSSKAFSVLMVNCMPDFNIEPAGCQCFPRYRYARREESDRERIRPFFVFQIRPTSVSARSVQFKGLAAPGFMGLPATADAIR